MYLFDPFFSGSTRTRLILSAAIATSFLACSSAEDPAPTSPDSAAVQQISVGGYHACAVSSKKAYCWGSNYNGALGDGTLVDRPFPAPVVGLSDVVEVAAGSSHTCALTSAGKVFCFGSNDQGQLGDGTTEDRPTPVEVAGLDWVTQITVGIDFSCALQKTGIAFCWGANNIGQLGTGGNFGPHTSPDFVVAAGQFVELRAGAEGACGVTNDGKVLCWGVIPLGVPGESSAKPFPAELPFGAGIVEISPGPHTSCARRADGSVDCWGNNTSGQLGDGTTTYSTSPVNVMLPSPAKQISTGNPTVEAIALVGEGYTCAALEDGRAACWGINEGGQLGDGTTESRSTPVIVPGLSDVAAIAAGGVSFYFGAEAFTCALKTDGSVWCWGRNSGGELGNGTTEASLVPVRVLF